MGTAAEDVFWKKIVRFAWPQRIMWHILSLAETKNRYTLTYFANIVWCVLDDAVKWPNQMVPYNDLISTKDVMCLQFPTTKLHKVHNKDVDHAARIHNGNLPT